VADALAVELSTTEAREDVGFCLGVVEPAIVVFGAYGIMMMTSIRCE
jgi:hypothetical protein